MNRDPRIRTGQYAGATPGAYSWCAVINGEYLRAERSGRVVPGRVRTFKTEEAAYQAAVKALDAGKQP